MKFFFSVVLVLFSFKSFCQQRQQPVRRTAPQLPQAFIGIPSPLSAFSIEWARPKYAECNTAAKIEYLTKTEKDVIYLLNLLRRYPILFLNTVVRKYPAKTRNTLLAQDKKYFQSLLTTLQNTKPLPMLEPDGKCFESAFCHAHTSGEKGYTGHDRQTADCKEKQYFNGECADYGHKEALDILMSLLIDQNVPSLGHRNICLTKSYTLVGVSIQPHIYYNYNAVLDFKIQYNW